MSLFQILPNLNDDDKACVALASAEYDLISGNTADYCVCIQSRAKYLNLAYSIKVVINSKCNLTPTHSLYIICLQLLMKNKSYHHVFNSNLRHEFLSKTSRLFESRLYFLLLLRETRLTLFPMCNVKVLKDPIRYKCCLYTEQYFDSALAKIGGSRRRCRPNRHLK